MSTSTNTKLTISYNFTRVKVPDLLALGEAAFTNLSASTKEFPAPPVPLPVFKQNLDNLRATSTAAMDGGKKDITLRNKDRHTVERNMRLLGAYVENVADGDAALLAISGFAAVPSRVPRAAQSLEQPSFRSIEYGASGQMLALIQGVKKAYSYDIRYAPLVNGVPGDWTIVSAAVARKPVTISGLTPGTNYALQVRALGRLGHTDWSDSATRMSV